MIAEVPAVDFDCDVFAHQIALPARSRRGIRLLHTAELRLDLPCAAIGGLPSHYQQRFVDARYEAARRMVAAAIENAVDFVLIAGGVLDPQLQGLRGPWFLAEQFDRLAEKNIPVIWAGHTAEMPERWPVWLPVPGNVHWLARGERAELTRQSEPTTRISVVCGQAAAPDEAASASASEYRLCVRPGEAEPHPHLEGFDYVALGGSSTERLVYGGPAYDPGSPQGREPSEAGEHGAAIVDLWRDACTIRRQATDCVRWHRISATVNSKTEPAGLREALARQVVARNRRDDVIHLATIQITGNGEEWEKLFQEPEALLRWVQQECGADAPIYPVRIEVLPDDRQLAQWEASDSPLAEIGRMYRDPQQCDSERLEEMLRALRIQPDSGEQRTPELVRRVTGEVLQVMSQS